MNRMITIALAAISSTVVILFVIYLDSFGMPMFDFTSHSYLISYFLVSCIIMAIKTISSDNHNTKNNNRILAVWRLEGSNLKEFVKNEYFSKKLLSKVLIGLIIFIIAISAYPLATSESMEITAIAASVFALLTGVVAIFKTSVDKSARKAENADYCDIIVTAKNIVLDGKIKYTWNDFSNDLVGADVVNDGSCDGALSIQYRKYGKRIFTVQIPIPAGKRSEAMEAAQALKANIRL